MFSALAIRAVSRTAVPPAALSRGVAGVAGRTLIVNLPGSTGGARDGLAVLGNRIEALHSAPTAIASFALTPESFEETISNVIFLGGDTDIDIPALP